MKIRKIRIKIVGKPRKIVIKKGKRKKSNIGAIFRALKIADKHKLDFSYIQ